MSLRDISACYSCGSARHSFYAEENGFTLVKCSGCGLLFLAKRPDDDEISEAQRHGKHGGGEARDATGVFRPDAIPPYMRTLRDLFEGDFDGKETWLDVGCGQGEFMVAVQKYSGGRIAVSGSEPNVYKQEAARERGLDISCFDVGSHEGRYDVVSLLNVYSHLPDPPAFLVSLKGLLKPGGELFLETGDTADLPVAAHPRPFYLPDHLSFASESIVTGILERLGFDILGVRKYPFIRVGPERFVRELVKAALPGYSSKLMSYLRSANRVRTDMFIRARARE
ncbi:class I SAM-dependent methyltransferase [Verrucomicrobiota bacterium]